MNLVRLYFECHGTPFPCLPLLTLAAELGLTPEELADRVTTPEDNRTRPLPKETR
jgi:hypothetical protein